MPKEVLRDGDTVYVQLDGVENPAAWVGVTNIDWLQLAQQKQRLVSLIWEDADDILWGLVHLIDAIQDSAEEDGIPIVTFTDAKEWEHDQQDRRMD